MESQNGRAGRDLKAHADPIPAIGWQNPALSKAHNRSFMEKLKENNPAICYQDFR